MGSSATTVGQGTNFLHTRYDLQKIFLGENRYNNEETLLNASGGNKDFVIGTVLGRITATGKLVPVASAAVDGSEIPVGVLACTVNLDNTAEAIVSVCIFGNVLQNKLILDGADTVDTVIVSTGRTIKDSLAGETAGIFLLEGLELSGQDNDLT